MLIWAVPMLIARCLMNENPVVLATSNLCSGYASLQVLKQISIELRQGEIVAIIGSNGAGKTTLLKTISRLVEIQGGTMQLFGEDLSRISAHEIISKGLAHVPEGRKIFAKMTVFENLELGAHAFQLSASELKERADQVFGLFPVLKQRKSQLGGTLSGGEQQMLALGRALMSNPKVLLLDEPSMGIAPILVAKIFETIQQLNKQGISVLLVEQDANKALSISSRAYVLETGSIVLSGLSEDLRNNTEIRKAYLGA